jgi:hypothetical protein
MARITGGRPPHPAGTSVDRLNPAAEKHVEETMKRPMLVLLFLALPFVAMAEQADRVPMTPAELAADSDLVVLAQVDRVDYEYRRGFPVEGRAWLKVLVRYKVPEPLDYLRVAEEGLGDDRCYFADTPMWQELPRYLVFLNSDEERGFRGNRNGCRLDVLVTGDNRYAVRWPQDGLILDESELGLVRELEFQGPGAFVDVREMTSIRRDDLQERYFLVDAGSGKYRYSRGILLEDFRRLLGEENLTTDRQQRGR